MRPWLWLPAELAHDLSPWALNTLSSLHPIAVPHWSPLEWRGLKFQNRLGVAGGVDKDARNLKAWWRFGAGFVEVGTVTPKPQSPNQGRRVDRELATRSVWNRLGFPSVGAERVGKRLAATAKPWPTPVFINIGMNRNTPLESAHEDYVQCIRELKSYADAFVINVSSPNTKGLRNLLEPAQLNRLLGALKLELAPTRESPSPSSSAPIPMLLKLSPDMNEGDLEAVFRVALDSGVSGFILTNTTTQRTDGSPFPPEGGVSGGRLSRISRDRLNVALKLLGPERQRMLVISTGGVLSASDVRERLDLGADLVQVYTALIFEGPWFLRRVARDFGATT